MNTRHYVIYSAKKYFSISKFKEGIEGSVNKHWNIFFICKKNVIIKMLVNLITIDCLNQ